ncbi:MAG: 2-oxo acid dehydrogenase subunit E2 [Treponema sp.]|nr:2-oxo acid dehydrogenase subunit E2 [Treponema sp.]
MAHILIMPRQGNTVESCVITGWKVKEGEMVTAGTIVCEVETDKASFEIPSGESGTVLKILYDEGDDVPVLSPILVIGAEGENWKISLTKFDEIRDSEEKTESNDSVHTTDNNNIPQSTFHSQHSQVSNLQSAVSFSSPRARSLAEKEYLSLESIPGTGPEGRIIERDVKSALEQRPPLTATAKAMGGYIPAFGSGLNGRVTIEDLSSSTPYSALSSSSSSITEVPIKGIRKVIADRMLNSLAQSAQFTLNASAPVSKLQEIRAKIKKNEIDSDELKFSVITINDLILFAVSRILPQFIYMNAHKAGDLIRTFEQIHLGIAVDSPRGLMVPVIRNANELSLSEISAESKRLAAACQNGSAKHDELSGSTFTVTNLGSLGITSFTPVLNIPEVAILGVCAIELKPVFTDGNYSFEPYIGFSLTINHQVVDGAPAARFLKTLCEAVANIDLLINN